jgi:hypothetical protein
MQEISQLRGVYIIGEVGRSDTRVKIGMTIKGPESRMRGIQSSGPLELLWWWDMPRASLKSIMMRESALHSRFADLRVFGEWFELRGELEQFLISPFTLADADRCKGCEGALRPIYLHPGDHRCTGCYADRCVKCGASSRNGAKIYQSPHMSSTIGRRCWGCWSELKAAGPRTMPQLIRLATLAVMDIEQLKDIIRDEENCDTATPLQ